MEKRPVHFTDTTLRDAHQSLWATRMRTEDMLPIAPVIDEVGFWSIEMWGGATFDVMLRYLDEDPWERIKKLKERMPKSRFQMLLRGQNLVGYRHYPDDIVVRFVRKAHEHGIEVFRVFDALNDVRNMEVAMRAVKECGAHAEGCIAYTVSPIHTIDHFVETARKLVDLGADTLCIKDMAGLLKPRATVELVTALKQNFDVPIHLHSHFVGGMATMSYVEGIRAGASIIDTASFPLSMGSSQPPTEVLAAALADSDVDVNLDFDRLFEIAEYFDEVRKRYGYRAGQTSLVHMKIFSHQIPGGMISNLYTQLEEQKALDKLNDVLEEVPRVRAEVGYPPLVTPLSQIVGTQAVLNVLAGKRWTVVSKEMKDYLRGYYGKPPGEIDPDILKKVIKSEDEIITERPGALLTKTFEEYKEEIKDLAESEEDVLSYALFPKEARAFFEKRKRYEVEKYQARTGEVATEMNHDELKKLLELVEGKDIAEIVIERNGTKITVRKSGATASPAPVAEGASDVAASSSSAAGSEGGGSSVRDANWKPITAPMVGTFYRAPSPEAPPYVEVGSQVAPGDVVCLIEAMKLFNEVTVEEAGIIREICVENGQPVEYGQPIFYFEPLEA